MSFQGLSIQSRQIDQSKNIFLIKVAGELDAHTFEDLQIEIEDLFDSDVYNIILDMAAVTYVSSAGVGLIAASHQNALGNDGKLIVTGLRDEIVTVFDTMGMMSMLNIAETNDEAISQF